MNIFRRGIRWWTVPWETDTIPFPWREAVGCADGRGAVYAFDIQQEALDATRIYLSEHGIADPERTNIRLICDSHTEIDRYLAEVPGEISAFVFNLGFMPGRDKTIMTTEDTSLPAIKKSGSIW